MTHDEIGKVLARVIFQAGDQHNDKVQRIQFMGGEYPEAETSLGGLCEASLAGVLSQKLESMAKGDAGST